MIAGSAGGTSCSTAARISAVTVGSSSLQPVAQSRPGPPVRTISRRYGVSAVAVRRPSRRPVRAAPPRTYRRYLWRVCAPVRREAEYRPAATLSELGRGIHRAQRYRHRADAFDGEPPRHPFGTVGEEQPDPSTFADPLVQQATGDPRGTLVCLGICEPVVRGHHMRFADAGNRQRIRIRSPHH